MDIKQLRKLNLDDRDDLKLFVNLVEERNFMTGPATSAIAIADMLLSFDEADSVKVWILVLSGLSGYFVSTSDKNNWNKKQEVNSRLSLIYSLFNSFENILDIIPYMKNVNVWAQKIMPEINETLRIAIYAMDKYISERFVKNVIYIPMTKHFEKESAKVKIATKAYLSFINEWLN